MSCCRCASLLLLLLVAATCAAASPLTTPGPDPANATAPAPSQPHQRTVAVLVIDVTRNTSSIVPIPLGSESGNATEAEVQLLREAPSLRCITEQKANLFLLVHLNRNWRHKLNLVRRLLSYTYQHSSTNVAIIFFNAFTNILATFGTAPLTTEAELLAALAQVQSTMEKDEKSAVSEHWNYFQLDDALNACFRYARLFLHQLSLDARPSILFSYFDDGAVINDATIDAAEKLMHQPESPFKSSVSLLQWPSRLPVPPQWARVSELLASSPRFQLTGQTETSLLAHVAGLAGSLCNETRSG